MTSIRVRFIRRPVVVAVLVALHATVAFAQQDFSKVEIKDHKVDGNIHMLEGSGGNIGVSAGPDGILIVDDQFAPLADKIRAALKGLGSDKPRFILNTHWHPDHTGGNPSFGKDGVIIAHENVRKRLMEKQKILGQAFNPLAKEGLPVITFAESVTIHFNDEDIRVIHFPHGHTDGDSVIFFTKSNVVHMGDDMFAGMFPFVDVDNGGSVQGMADNVAKILSQIPPDAKIIPGHGPVSTVDDLKEFQKMLAESVDVVKSRIKAGKTLEQVKSEGMPDAWKSWGNGFIKTDAWLETVFKSVSGEKKQ
ncbi:MAG: MBL fold metallo-hydrolase [Planctomycetes bacterium]|nr:MBL fold metallo-hydrolase [Planctomycetota bacterium]MBI3835466.1 MBL fold metallo-hydrolase [Planctomycetota bacterium]